MIGLDLAKQHLRVDDDGEDTLIEQYARAAAAWVEGYTGVLLTRRERTVRGGYAGTCVFLPMPDPVLSAVTYTDRNGSMVETVGWRVEGDRLIPPFGWVWGRAITATVIAGFSEGEVPDDLIAAQMLLVGHWYANREGVLAGTIATTLPMGVEALCQPHRVVRL